MRVFELRMDLKRQHKQYESDLIGISVMLEDGDYVHEVMSVARRVCLGEEVPGLRGGSLSLPLNQTEMVLPTKEALKQAPTKEEPVKAEPAKKAAPKKETPAKEAAPAKTEEPAKEEPAKEEPIKEEPAKAEPAKKAKPSKAIAYDRNSDVHKKHFGAMLDKHFPNWRKELMTKAVTASKTLEGKDFMDNTGNLLPEFEKELLGLMK